MKNYKYDKIKEIDESSIEIELEDLRAKLQDKKLEDMKINVVGRISPVITSFCRIFENNT